MASCLAHDRLRETAVKAQMSLANEDSILKMLRGSKISSSVLSHVFTRTVSGSNKIKVAAGTRVHSAGPAHPGKAGGKQCFRWTGKGAGRVRTNSGCTTAVRETHATESHEDNPLP